MATTERVQETLGEYREMLRVDGADLELTTVVAGTAHVRLLIGPETCVDCILGKDMLEAVLLQGLSDSGAGVTQVVVDDPRVASRSPSA